MASAASPALTPAVSPAGRRPRRLRAAVGRWLRLTPTFVWIFFLILLPNLFLVFYSLWKNDIGTISHTWNTDNYHEVFSSDVFRTLLKLSLIHI